MIELDLQCASTGAAPALADLQRCCELALRQRSGDSELTIRIGGIYGQLLEWIRGILQNYNSI
jgi:hypothetical protein